MVDDPVSMRMPSRAAHFDGTGGRGRVGGGPGHGGKLAAGIVMKMCFVVGSTANSNLIECYV